MSFHGGLLDRLGGGVNTIFGGRDDPRLSPEENRAAKSDALVTAGLSTLLAQGPGGVSPTTLQALSQGALAGREAGTGSREEELRRNQQAQLQTLVDSGEVGPEALQELFMQAIATGNVEAMRALSGVLPAVLSGGGAAARPTVIRSQNVDGVNMDIMFDKETGKEIEVLGRSAVTGAGLGPPRQIKHFDEARGRLIFSSVLPDGRPGQFLANVDAGDTAGSAIQREGEAKARLIRDTAERLDLVDDATRGVLPTLVARGPAFIKEGANWALSGNWSPFQNQRAQDAVIEALGFINVVINYLSGKQMTEQETRRYWGALIPGPGDSDASVARKSRARAVMVEAISQDRWKAVQDEEGNWIYQNVDETLQQIIAEATGPAATDDSGAPVPGFGHLVPGGGN